MLLSDNKNIYSEYTVKFTGVFGSTAVDYVHQFTTYLLLYSAYL